MSFSQVSTPTATVVYPWARFSLKNRGVDREREDEILASFPVFIHEFSRKALCLIHVTFFRPTEVYAVLQMFLVLFFRRGLVHLPEPPVRSSKCNASVLAF